MTRRQPFRPPPPQIHADPLRGNPCDSHDPQRCVPPLKGLRETLTASGSYRALSPYGETLPSETTGSPCALPQPIPNSKFLIPNWSYTFSAKERDPETGLSYFGARYYNSDLNIWLSVDPMSDKYPSLSPYVYCANNPVRLVDPNGEEVYILGDDVAAALEQLQNQTNLKLSIGADGKLSCEGSAETEIDMLISQSIDDENITVNLITGKGKDFGDGNVINCGGGYGGNYYDDGKVCTEQFVCPSNLANLDMLVGDNKTGLTMVHELAESFYGGEIALSEKRSSPQSRYENSTYPRAHKKANKIAGGDFNHNLWFFNKKPSFMDDNTAKRFIPHIEIWERRQK